MALELCATWVPAPRTAPQPRASGQAQLEQPRAALSLGWVLRSLLRLGYLMLSFSHQDSTQKSERLPFLLLFPLCFLSILKGLQLSLVQELSYSISLRMSQTLDKYKDFSSKQLSLPCIAVITVTF